MWRVVRTQFKSPLPLSFMFLESSRLFPPLHVQLQTGKCKLPDFWGLLQRAQDLLLGDAEDSVSFDSEGNFVFNRRLRGMQRISLMVCSWSITQIHAAVNIIGPEMLKNQAEFGRTCAAVFKIFFNPALYRRTQCTQRLVSGVAIAAIPSV